MTGGSRNFRTGGVVPARYNSWGLLTTIIVYACYTVKIYKNDPESDTKGDIGEGAGPGSSVVICYKN